MKSTAAALPVDADPHLNHERRGSAATPLARPIDLVHLTRQSFGDKRLETELLRLFMRQSQQIDKSLETAAEEDQAVSSVEMLHMLSGSARAIGATEVAFLAGGLELVMRRGGKASLDATDRRRLSDLVTQTNLYIAELLDQA